MTRSFVWWFGCAVVLAGFSAAAFGQTKTWVGGDGDFGDPNKWSPTGVPGAGNIALFNSGSDPTVTFDNSPNLLNNPVNNLALTITGGSSVTLRSGGDGIYTYHLSDDVNVYGGFLGIGVVGGNLPLIVDDDFSIANPTSASTSATVNSRSDVSLGGDLKIASENLLTFGTLALFSSTLTQSGTGTITVGSATNGTGEIGIGLGTLTTGTGLMTINNTGTVLVGSNGRLNANGDITISGGVLEHDALSLPFIWANGHTMTIQNAGRATFEGSYSTPTNSILNITGSSSKLEAINGGDLTISNNTTLTVGLGGLVSAADVLDISNSTLIVNTNGTLSAGNAMNINNVTATVATGGQFTAGHYHIGTTAFQPLTFSGIGTSVTATSGTKSEFGLAGKTANVTFSNGAAGFFEGGIDLARSTTAGTTSVLTIQSGADLTNTGDITLASLGGSTTSATLTVTDPGSTLIFDSNETLTVGAATGTAEVHVNNQGVLTVSTGGSTTVNASGAINVNGGTADLKTLTVNSGGEINFTAGSLSYLGNLTVGTGGILGANLNLGSNRQLTLSGTTTVGTNGILTVSGGTLSTGALAINSGRTATVSSGTLNNAGAMTVNGNANVSGGTLNNTGGLTVNNGATVNFTGGTFAVGGTTTINTGGSFVLSGLSGFSTTTLANQGDFQLNNNLTATAAITTVNNTGLIRGNGRLTGTVNNNFVSGVRGEIRGENGKYLRLQGTNGTNSGRVNLQGGTVEFSQALTNGANGIIEGNGTLMVGSISGSLTNNGNIAFSAGNTSVHGDVINNESITVTGGGTATFYDDVVQNDTFTVSKVGSTTSVAVFLGQFSGTGGISGDGDVFFEGDITPGSSPATVEIEGNAHIESTARLIIELGGTTPGSGYDQLHVGGQLELDGTLVVKLYDGFVPVQTQVFNILDWGSLSGQFSSIQFVDEDDDPFDPAGIAVWNTQDLYTDGTIAVRVPGDAEGNNDVSGSDFVVWQTNFPSASGHTYATGDYDGDGDVDGADFVVWQTNFGFHPPPSPGVAPVPEPEAFALMAATLPALIIAFRRRVRRRG